MKLGQLFQIGPRRIGQASPPQVKSERLITAEAMLREALESQQSVARNMPSLQLLLGAEKAALAAEEARTSVELAKIELEEALQESQ